MVSSNLITLLTETIDNTEVLTELHNIAESSKLLNNQMYLLTVLISALLMFWLFYRFLKQFF